MMGTLLYWMVNRTVYLFLKTLFRLQVHGQENIPAEGPIIAAANHVSFLDPPALSCAMNRQVFFMAKQELFKYRPLAWFFQSIGTFPVRRGTGDRRALKQAITILEEGNILGMFPEGTRRSGNVQLGIVYMALKTSAPILPVALRNTDRRTSGGPIRVIIGQPITFETGGRKPSQEVRKEMAEKVMDAIQELG